MNIENVLIGFSIFSMFITLMFMYNENFIETIGFFSVLIEVFYYIYFVFSDKKNEHDFFFFFST